MIRGRQWGLATVLPVAVFACAPGIAVPGPVEIQAWAVYFDSERGLAELQQHGELFDRVSLFAYELDPAGSPTPAPNMDTMIAPFFDLAAVKGFEPWVTVVNDVRSDVDRVVAKDSTLIHELLADPARRVRHARELAARVADDGFRGLHLDYERVPESDRVPFQAFIRVLGSELRQRGLGLEVVVEPVTGPLPAAGNSRVVVMAYDLFGEHSGPGPRSTPDFVTELGSRGAVDSDSAAALAVAVGGFSWDADGAVDPIDWSEARERAAESSRTRRDAADVPSALLGDGSEIWFEDPTSVLGKWQAAWNAGFRRLAIWRLGGNDERLFDLIRQLK
jgi:hypothetical protein